MRADPRPTRRRHLTRAARRRISPALVRALVWAGLTFCVWHNLPCADGRPVPDELWRSACYSDILPLYGGRGLGEGKIPYLESPVEYPVLTGALMALAGLSVHWLNRHGWLLPAVQALGFTTVDEGIVYFWVTAGLLAAMALAVVGMMLRMRAERLHDVALVAVAPSIAVASFVNWDLLAVSLSVGGLLAWSRRHPGVAGVLLGLGTAAKIYPAVMIVALLVLCARTDEAFTRRDGIRAGGRLVAGAAGSWLAVNLPVALAAPSGWWRPYSFSAERWIDWGSFWFILDHLKRGWSALAVLTPLYGHVPALNRSALAMFALACVGLAVLVRCAPRRPRVASVTFLAVAAFMLSNKVWSPQFVLWLVPLAVLARPRWTLLLPWQLVELAYFLAHLRSSLGGRDEYALVQISIGRWLAVAALAAAVVADTLRPERDVVRDPQGQDPDAGVLVPQADAAR